jgi:hypothetical protein
MIDRSPALWPPIRGAISPVPTPITLVEDRVVSIVKYDRQILATPDRVTPKSRSNDLEFSGMVSAVSLATLTALLRTGSLQGTNRRYRGAIASRSWPS